MPPAKKKPAKKVVAKPKKAQPAKIHSKTLSLLVSVGEEDRDRSIEEFLAAVQAALKGGKVKAKHVTVAGSYYVLDGKTCLPEDYDPKTQNFKPGATPPPWAGGPDLKRVVEKQETESEHKPRTPAEALRDLRENTNYGKAPRKTSKWDRGDEDLDEFEWDESDVENEEKLHAAADRSAKRAVKRIVEKKKETPKKRVVKKVVKKTAEKPSRRVVRRKK